MQSPGNAPRASVVTDDPQIEMASRDGRVIAALPGLTHPGELPVEAIRRPMPFAARMQAFLIVVMFVAFICILQQGNKSLYQIGLPVLIVAAFMQIAYGNIPPTTGFVKSFGLLLMTWGIVAVLVAVSIYLTPSLIQLGQSGS